MRIDPVAFMAITGMGLATYATRAGGFWLMGRVPIAPGVERWLAAVPGAILVAIVAPLVLASGPAGWLAVAGTALVAARTGNLLLAIAAGVALASVLRLLF
ncbi:MAG TPA: AzlD domain-containing protein [Ktedonobacterales bacterium]|jgi:uncharacterized membrane protein